MNENKKIPQHIAIIMDGNGRWAKQRGKDRSEGHFAGMMALRATVKAAAEIGVKYLTVYAFSTENWGRSKIEVTYLMNMLAKYLKDRLPEMMQKNVRLHAIAPKVECGRVYLVEGEWNEEFVDEVCGFPTKVHDEYVDLLGYAVNYFMEDDAEIPDDVDALFSI